ncbi:MAG: UDP-N-acetylglucosamine 2-epimerase [Candidatus Omnitrophota bacterium]
MTRKIMFTTVARSDYGYFCPIIEKIKDIKSLDVRLLITGSHYDPNAGMTYRDIKKHSRIKIITIDPYKGRSNMREENIAANILNGLAKIDFKPDILVLLGDRFEILPIAYFCALKNIFIAHLFGGENDTAHCLDTLIRNAVTKMAHIHFVAHEDIKKRLICMGEEAPRIKVSGISSITTICQNKDFYNDFIFSFLSKHKIAADKPLVNVCYHPVTTDRTVSIKELKALLTALRKMKRYTYIWSGINSDPGSLELKNIILNFASKNKNVYFFDNLGSNNYYSLLENAKFMIGNSSSGLLEAASFNLPVINVGERQGGRLHGDNVIDVKANSVDIVNAIGKTVDMKLNYKNPFYKHDCTDIIVDTLTNIRLDRKLRLKKLKCNIKTVLKRS